MHIILVVQLKRLIPRLKDHFIYIPKGSIHRRENTGLEDLILVEVQLGSYLGEDDIKRYQDDYNRK